MFHGTRHQARQGACLYRRAGRNDLSLFSYQEKTYRENSSAIDAVVRQWFEEYVVDPDNKQQRLCPAGRTGKR